MYKVKFEHENCMVTAWCKDVDQYSETTGLSLKFTDEFGNVITDIVFDVDTMFDIEMYASELLYNKKYCPDALEEMDYE